MQPSLLLEILRGSDPGIAVSPAHIYFDEEVGVRISLDSDQNVDDIDVHFQAQIVVPHDHNVEDNEAAVFEGTLLASEAEKDGLRRIWQPRIHVKSSRTRENAKLELTVVAIRRDHEDLVPEKSRFLESLVPVGVNSPFGLIGGTRMQVHNPPSANGTDSPSLSRTTSTIELAPAKSKERRPGVHKADQEVARAFLRIPLVPVIDMGLRCVRPMLEKDRLIAQLDVGSRGQNLRIEKLDLSLYQGTCDSVAPAELPLVIPVNSGRSFCYNLQTLVATSSNVNTKATICVEYHVLDTLESPLDGAALIKTSWTTGVDFQDAAGPIPKTPTLDNVPSPSLKRQNSSVSLASMGSGAPESVRGSSGPRVPLSGVTMFLTGPNHVKLGSVFEWKVMVINKSSRPRKLSLCFYAKDSTQAFFTRNEERALVSDITTLQRRVDAYRANLGGDSGVIPLCSELRVGLLAPHSCFESTVRLLAVAPGRHCIDTSTVVDLTSGDTYDTGELLEVTVQA